MKKFQIFKKVNGQQPKGYKLAIYGTFEEAQGDLRKMLLNEYGIEGEDHENRNYEYFNDAVIADWKAQNVGEELNFEFYTVPGIYRDGELIYSDAEINSPDFDSYNYDNWSEYIEEIEVEE